MSQVTKLDTAILLLTSSTPVWLYSRKFYRLGVNAFVFSWRTFSEMEASVFTQNKCVLYLGCKILLFCWDIILRSHEEFLYCGLNLLFCVACKVFLSRVWKCSRSSRGSRGELDVIWCWEVFLFLCVGNFGFTRPIQDYGSGPGTPLAHK